MRVGKDSAGAQFEPLHKMGMPLTTKTNERPHWSSLAQFYCTQSNLKLALVKDSFLGSILAGKRDFHLIERLSAISIWPPKLRIGDRHTHDHLSPCVVIAASCSMISPCGVVMRITAVSGISPQCSMVMRAATRHLPVGVILSQMNISQARLANGPPGGYPSRYRPAGAVGPQSQPNW